MEIKMKKYILLTMMLMTSNLALAQTAAIVHGNTKCKDLVFESSFSIDLPGNRTLVTRSQGDKMLALNSWFSGYANGLNAAGYSGSWSQRLKDGVENYCQKYPNKTLKVATKSVVFARD
jgi:hypothetical protein